jgi:Tol biopolymer transport system component
VFSEYTERVDSDVWIYSEGKATPFLASAFSEQSARFSIDGRFVAYAADDGGVSHVYLQPFPGPGRRAAVSVEESSRPRWSADGRSLFFKSGQRIMVVPLQTNPVLRIGQPKVQLRDPDLSASLIIHESLHALGLGEDPPSGRDITQRIERQCWKPAAQMP